MWLMTEVCVAVGTLGAATDQSSCKTNLTLTAPPATPSPPSNPQLLSAKCTQYDIALINHPKQSMFNLWRAGLTRKFITCSRKTACVPLNQASIYLQETGLYRGKTKSATKKADYGSVFQAEFRRQSPASLYHPVAFSWWMTCLHDFLDYTCQKDLGIFLKHICKTWIPNYLLRIRVG